MLSRGIYNRDGEQVCILDGTRILTIEGDVIGELRGHIVYDRDGERHWVIEGDALLDLRGNNIGYLGEPAREDR